MVYLRPSLGRFPYLSSDFSDTDILQLLKVSPNQQANHQTFRVVLDLSSMSKRRNFLTTYGTLHTCVVEAVDLIETTSSSNKKVKVTKCNVFAVLKVIDEAGTDIRHYNTETHPFYTSESLVIGEEFIFENVSSAHSLLVSFFSVSLEKEKAPHAPVTVAQNCLGFTQIPLSRLEDGVSVGYHCFVFAGCMY